VPLRGWIDPDDRLWRHPSEVAGSRPVSGQISTIHRYRVPFMVVVGAAAVMAAAAWETARLVGQAVQGPGGHLIAMLAATVVGAAIYFGAQAVMRAPELAWVSAALTGRGRHLPRLRSRQP